MDKLEPNLAFLEPVYTVGQLAKRIGVSPRTVVNWCDNGLLEHFRLPHNPNGKLSPQRKVLQRQLVKFLREQKMVELLDRFGEVSGPIYCLGLSPELLRLTATILGTPSKLVDAESFFYLGMLMRDRRPAGVILDFNAGRSQCLYAVQKIAAHCLLPVIGVVYEDEEAQAQRGDHKLFRELLTSPVEPATLARAIVRLEHFYATSHQQA